MDSRIANALKVMQDRAEERQTVGGVAERVGLSRSRFEFLFQRETGTTFKRRLLDLRMGKAAGLLAADSAGIKQVAWAVGYHCPSSFTRDFKARFGNTPSQYRKELIQSRRSKKQDVLLSDCS